MGIELVISKKVYEMLYSCFCARVASSAF